MLCKCLVGQAFQHILGFGSGEQICPLPFRLQLGQQEAGEPVLLGLGEFGGPVECFLEKLVHR